MNLKKLLAMFFIIFVAVNHHCFAFEGEIRLHLNDLKRVVHKNILGVPDRVDVTIFWDAYSRDGGQWVRSDISTFESFTAICGEKGDEKSIEESEQIDQNFYSFKDRIAGKEYFFTVKGKMKGGEVIYSDTAWVVTGKLYTDINAASIKWYHWIPFNGRIPLWVLGRERFYDGATRAGKIAFWLIWNFFLAGMMIWGFFCIRILSLGNVFPLRRGLRIGKGYEGIYNSLESREFRSIIEEWRDIVKRCNENIRRELEEGSCSDITEIESANTTFWRDKGAKVIRNLIRRVSLPSMIRFPAARIIKAGLENHELGGFHWLEVSREVDRAIENRASSEIERLRRESLIDWLWNLGTLAPLIGLFGTATGISHAFAMLTFVKSNITQSELVKSLAGGIYEALWTTIEGLFVGIILMLLYYWYNNKLSWIYSKWEEIYVYVAEKL